LKDTWINVCGAVENVLQLEKDVMTSLLNVHECGRGVNTEKKEDPQV
jgi:hypothetical protein